MLASREWTAPFVRRAVLLLLTSTLASAASITVAPTVTPASGLYQYAYSITNSTPDDAFLIDIQVPKDPSAVSNLAAPAGFKAAFDSGLGLVSFLEDTSFFGATPTSGFSFNSPDAPGSAGFQATLVAAASGSLYTISGSTVAPAPLASVPEPEYPMLLGTGLMVFAVIGRRIRRGQMKITRQD